MVVIMLAISVAVASIVTARFQRWAGTIPSEQIENAAVAARRFDQFKIAPEPSVYRKHRRGEPFGRKASN